MSFWTNGIFIKDKNMSVMGQRDEWSCWSSEMPESPCEGRWGGRHHGKAGGEGDTLGRQVGRETFLTLARILGKHVIALPAEAV
jgi:hypothetical protein